MSGFSLNETVRMEELGSLRARHIPLRKRHDFKDLIMQSV